MEKLAWIVHHAAVPQARTATAGVFVLLSLAGTFALAWGRGMSVSSPTPAEAASNSMPLGTSGQSEPAPAAEARAGGAFLGVVLARSAAEIAPRFEGKLREVHVRLGDQVRAGAVIAELDAPTLRYELRVAEAELKAAEVEQARTSVEVDEAKERFARRRSLAAESLTSREELAAARYQEQMASRRLDATRAQIELRLAHVERLRRDNADTQITAPFDGFVAARYVDPGATVRPSSPIIRLINMSDLFVRFAVPEQQARSMIVGQRVRVSLDDASTGLGGVVDKVAPEVDAASRMVFVEAKLDPLDPTAPLLSGVMVRVSVKEAQAAPTLAPAAPEP